MEPKLANKIGHICAAAFVLCITAAFIALTARFIWWLLL